MRFFNHQTHHRGQAHAMLTAAGTRPDRPTCRSCRGWGEMVPDGIVVSGMADPMDEGQGTSSRMQAHKWPGFGFGQRRHGAGPHSGRA
ncbi:MAG: hypothetical protein R3D03_11080 [Geminicoccaceae bacterium]